ncbi:hypothetical protein EZS27_009503 [termite gut metagenome]|uniref:DUF3276 family protein n=1 Tax=termite gut metagenome TaxID=433724 RepID=A0A5J4SBW6_9ZZZZ
MNPILKALTIMEDFKKTSGNSEMNDREIVFSKSIKAGKRIYYLDVKKNRKEEMFLAITESKKIVQGEGEDVQVSFEKHKIFLYKEDFEKFMVGLEQAIAYIRERQEIPKRDYYEKEEENDIDTTENKEESSSKVEIDIDF